MMHLLHIVPSYLPATRYGGPIYSVHGLARALVDRGHRVEVFTTNVDGPSLSPVPVLQPVMVDGVEVTYFPTHIGRRIYRSPSMFEALDARIGEFDLLHLHSVFLWPTSMAAAVARRNGVPYVISPRGMLVRELIRRKSRILKTAWISLFERGNLRGAGSIHLTSETEARDFRDLHLPARRIDLIPNGIDLPNYPSPRTRLTPQAVARRPVVLSLGRISWKKGIDRLIRAMPRVPTAELIIAGNDDERLIPALNEVARAVGVADRVRFVGAVFGDDKWLTFAQADIFALPSYSENFGMAVLEAMACGLPVIVTPEVGLADAIINAGAGVVSDGDPRAFGDAIAALLLQPDLLGRMGAAGRRAAQERFSWLAVAQRMDELYTELVYVADPSLEGTVRA
jgi:glycosyltransferase involved in cell wall biosynthesis